MGGVPVGEDKSTQWKGMIVWLSRRAAQLSGIFMITAMITIIFDLSGRYFFNSPLPGSVELVRTFLVVLVFFGLANTQRKDEHIKMDLLLNYISPRVKLLLEIFGLSIALLVYAFTTYATIPVVIQSVIHGEYETGLIPFPMWPARIFMGVGLLLLVLQLVCDLIQKIAFGKNSFAVSKKTEGENKWNQL